MIPFGNPGASIGNRPPLGQPTHVLAHGHLTRMDSRPGAKITQPLQERGNGTTGRLLSNFTPFFFLEAFCDILRRQAE